MLPISNKGDMKQGLRDKVLEGLVYQKGEGLAEQKGRSVLP